jgi:Collagen triple helix repeat (20 copies)
MMKKIGRRISFAHVAMTIAVVFAMTGGAYAATKIVITSIKQISPKVVKQLTGKTGPAGPAGRAGATGPAGAPGATGPVGATGSTGPAGSTGGTGTAGKEGSPWTAGGTLPSGKTETGVWGLAAQPGFIAKSVEFAYAPISFAIPLKASLAEGKVHILLPGEKGAGGKTCPTTSSVSQPEAEPGNLCIFEREGVFNLGGIGTYAPGTGEETGEVGPTGVLVQMTPTTKGEAIGVSGTWAVTAE